MIKLQAIKKNNGGNMNQSTQLKPVNETAKRLTNIDRLLKKLDEEKKTANTARIAVINRNIEELKKEKAQLHKKTYNFQSVILFL